MEEIIITAETAILANRLGISVKTNAYYTTDGELRHCQKGSKVWDDMNTDKNTEFAAYTQSSLQKIIRETCQLNITVHVADRYLSKDKNKVSWLYKIVALTAPFDTESRDFYDSFEEALEAALQEAITLSKNK